MIKYVIFDMDGVLIDSEIVYMKLFQSFLKENGVTVHLDELHFLAGSSRKVEDQFMKEKLQISENEAKQRKYEFYDRNPVDYLSIRKRYVVELLDYLKEQDIKIALASSSPRDNIEEVLNACEIQSYFSIIASGEDFHETKPNPEIYEYTIKKLGAKKEEVFVIEDSVYGIQAGKNANLKVIALEDKILQHDTSQADYVIEDLCEVIDIIKREE